MVFGNSSWNFPSLAIQQPWRWSVYHNYHYEGPFTAVKMFVSWITRVSFPGVIGVPLVNHLEPRSEYLRVLCNVSGVCSRAASGVGDDGTSHLKMPTPIKHPPITTSSMHGRGEANISCSFIHCKFSELQNNFMSTFTALFNSLFVISAIWTLKNKLIILTATKRVNEAAIRFCDVMSAIWDNLISVGLRI